jgi:hypothetical protein
MIFFEHENLPHPLRLSFKKSMTHVNVQVLQKKKKKKKKRKGDNRKKPWQKNSVVKYRSNLQYI